MSQREFAIVLAHSQLCAMCRDRLLTNPNLVLARHSLTAAERETLGHLSFEDFISPATLTRAANIALADLDAYRDEAVVRLRHL